jgi:DNA-binding response OmpR family regulator
MKKKIVLSLEDEPEIAQLIRVVLDHPQIDLVQVSSGSEVMDTMRAVQPDLVILDVMVPGVDGWTIHQAIREDDTFKDMPIIMLTVLQREYAQRREVTKSPVGEFISKPFDASDLRTRVEKLLKTPLWSARKPAGSETADTR